VVIVIDDDASIRLLIRKTLERRGFAVLLASDGEEGLKRLEEADRADLALIDQVMPGLDGTQVAELFRRRAPETKLLLCSGQSADHLRLELFDGFLPKPFRPAALVEEVSQLLTG
ncbi:MAG: response regulator, partial [Holophagales bacterium]|nr:response regulator [Holophagales bacterium]